MLKVLALGAALAGGGLLFAKVLDSPDGLRVEHLTETADQVSAAADTTVQTAQSTAATVEQTAKSTARTAEAVMDTTAKGVGGMVDAGRNAMNTVTGWFSPSKPSEAKPAARSVVSQQSAALRSKSSAMAIQRDVEASPAAEEEVVPPTSE